MPKYLIERELPGAGRLGEEELRAISAKSNAVLHELGGDVVWQQSFVTADKLYCIYIAPNEERIREHAARGGFPADTITRVTQVIDPATGWRDGQPATGS
jgi:hypothetical protein